MGEVRNVVLGAFSRKGTKMPPIPEFEESAPLEYELLTGRKAGRRRGGAAGMMDALAALEKDQADGR